MVLFDGPVVSGCPPLNEGSHDGSYIMITIMCETGIWENVMICQWPRDNSEYAPSQWEMALQCNAISYWLDAYTEWSLVTHFNSNSKVAVFGSHA